MDYITVTKDNGENEIMEVVTIFNKSESNYNYIIYKSLNTNDYYTAKYLGNDVVDLDTNLTDEEKKYANAILGTLVGD